MNEDLMCTGGNASSVSLRYALEHVSKNSVEGIWKNVCQAKMQKLLNLQPRLQLIQDSKLVTVGDAETNAHVSDIARCMRRLQYTTAPKATTQGVQKRKDKEMVQNLKTNSQVALQEIAQKQDKIAAELHGLQKSIKLQDSQHRAARISNMNTLSGVIADARPPLHQVSKQIEHLARMITDFACVAPSSTARFEKVTTHNSPTPRATASKSALATEARIPPRNKDSTRQTLKTLMRHFDQMSASYTDRASCLAIQKKKRQLTPFRELIWNKQSTEKQLLQCCEQVYALCNTTDINVPSASSAKTERLSEEITQRVKSDLKYLKNTLYRD